MKVQIEEEISDLKKEVHGIRSLLMELLDPDFGMQLTDNIVRRIKKARKDGRYLNDLDVLCELEK